jgi:predicted amidohydrolase YtcJ
MRGVRAARRDPRGGDEAHGERADVVVLDRRLDSAAGLQEARVRATLVAGEVVFDRGVA